MTYSQLGQDDWILNLIDKPKGYFVEFGATDGVEKSNTLLLEQQGWSGIVAEPAKMWHESLLKNRTCHIDLSCVSITTGDTVKFTEAGEYSTISAYIKSDHHSGNRQTNNEYEVPTITLQDLLDKYNAPTVIDYLSIDTEGSELDILENYFQSATRTITAITVEHNYTPAKDSIHKLLTGLGYSQFDPTQTRWDSWYHKTA
jgi:FkbM family methyltransferase